MTPVRKALYCLKRPNGKRKLFSVYSQERTELGTTKNVTVPDADITTINERYAAGDIDFATANKMAEGVRARLQGTIPTTFNGANEKILDKQLEYYFMEKPFLVDDSATANKYKRAVRALGNLPLLTVTRKDALNAVLKLATNQQQREAVAKLNSLFKRMGRDLVLPSPPKQHSKIKYVSEDELTTILNNMPDGPIRSAIKLSFYSGLRLGELRALTSRCLGNDKNIINVEEQVDVHHTRRQPKNRKIRKAYLHNKGLEAFSQWTAVPCPYSHKQLQLAFTNACIKHLGRHELTWHCLRHSYAVHMISSAVPIELVAQSLGNSVKVCEDFYSGFVLSDRGIDTISRILNG